MTDAIQNRRVACIGTGTIGRAWAIAFAAAGCRTALYDALPGAADRSVDAVAAALADLEAAGMIASAADALALVSIESDLEAAIAGADYVQESIREDLALKRVLYTEMDQVASAHTIFGSSTSALPGSAFMCGLFISPRCLVAHPTNPPYLVPLTEMCVTPETARETLVFATDFLRRVGQAPVLIKKEVTGYVLNRLQAAVINEALNLVAADVIAPDELDDVMTRGLGLRWAFMGPFLTGHLNASGGYADYMHLYGDAYRSILDDMRTPYHWGDAEIEAVDAAMPPLGAGGTAKAQAWRDRRLMALRLHLDSAAPLSE